MPDLERFFKNKAVVLIFIGFLIGAAFSPLFVSAYVTKHGIDGSNTTWETTGQGMISTSKDGRLFNATGADLQNAINYIDGVGIVKVLSNITLTSGITGKQNVILDFQGHTVIPSSSFDMFTMKDDFQVWNAFVDVSGITFEDHNAVFLFDGADTLDSYNTRLYDIRMLSTSYQGSAIKFYCDATTEKVCFSRIVAVSTKFFNCSINMTCIAPSGSAYINGNIFNNFVSHSDKYIIYQDMGSSSYNAIDGNIFSDYQIQVSPSTEEVIHVEGGTNEFTGRTWDITTMAGVAAHNLTSTSSGNYIVDYIDRTYFNDSGTNNQIITRSTMNPYRTSNVPWFLPTTGNPFFYIYGNDTGAGTNKYGRLRVSSSGSFIIQSQTSEGLYLTGYGLVLNYDSNSEISCFTGAGAGENKELQIYGRNAGNTAARSMNFSWGDGANDYGIIEAYGGTKVTDLILATTQTNQPVSGSCYWSETDSRLYIYNATSAAWMSTSFS